MKLLGRGVSARNALVDASSPTWKGSFAAMSYVVTGTMGFPLASTEGAVVEVTGDAAFPFLSAPFGLVT